MLEELREIDTTAIEELVKIKKEQDRLVGFRNKADQMRGSVDDAVYRRVLADYDNRESMLDKEAEPLKVKARGEYEKLCAIFNRIRDSLEQARKAKEELEFRHAVGELDETQLAELLAEPENALENCQSQLEDSEKLKARFLEAFHSLEELEVKAKEKLHEQNEIRPEAKPEAGSDIEEQAKPDDKPAAVAKKEPEAILSEAPKVEPEAESKIKPQAEPNPESAVEPKSDSNVEAEVKPEVKPKIKRRFSSRFKSEARPSKASNIEPEVKPKIKPEAESKIEPDLWPEVESEALVSEPETPVQGTSTDKTFIRPMSDAGDGLFAVPQAKLVAIEQGKPRDEYTLGIMNTIGRAQDNTIRIQSPTVSRKHAVVTATATEFTLKDLGSLSGTYVNDKKIAECTLADRDRIKIGDVDLVFRLL